MYRSLGGVFFCWLSNSTFFPDARFQKLKEYFLKKNIRKSFFKKNNCKQVTLPYMPGNPNPRTNDEFLNLGDRTKTSGLAYLF